MSEKIITSGNEEHPGNAVHLEKHRLPESQYIWEMRYNQETQSTQASSASGRSVHSQSAGTQSVHLRSRGCEALSQGQEGQVCFPAKRMDHTQALGLSRPKLKSLLLIDSATL